MTDETLTLEPSSRRELMQAIDAHYYNLTNAEGDASGGLIVLLDRRQNAVRAEVHLLDELPDDIAASLVRQAYHILGERYFADAPLPLQVRESFQLGETLRVSLGDPALATANTRGNNWLSIAGAIAGTVLLIGLVWGGLTWARNRLAADDTLETVNVQQPGSETNQEQPANAPTATIEIPTPPPSGSLPPSVNANPNIKKDARVRISEGFTLTLRSEAGAEAGEIVGYMTSDNQAVVVDGPILTQGESDTIVWWYIRLDDGTEAWAAANTSKFRLLELAQ